MEAIKYPYVDKQDPLQKRMPVESAFTCFTAFRTKDSAPEKLRLGSVKLGTCMRSWRLATHL
jgi:hypothetical protein